MDKNIPVAHHSIW